MLASCIKSEAANIQLNSDDCRSPAQCFATSACFSQRLALQLGRLTRCYVLLALVLSAMTIQAEEWHKGENLIFDNPSLLEKYDRYQKSQPGWQSFQYRSKERQAEDMLTVNIVEIKNADLTEFRASQDEPGAESCDTFSSVEIDDKDRNGYKAVMWKTNCSLEESNIQTIQLAISGRKNLFHLRKRWVGEVTNWEDWIFTVEHTLVCDTRRKKKHPCPEGYTKIGT